MVACARRPELAPAVPPTDDNVLYADDFAVGRTGNWYTEADELGLTAVLDEKMVVEVTAANTLQYTMLREVTFSDFILEVEVAQLAGHPESSFGVLFRMQSPTEFYRFDITGDGRYMLERRNADGSWTRFLEDWSPVPVLKSGLNATNRLRVAAAGPQIAVYANNQLLHQVADAGYYSSGAIALDAGAFSESGLSVAFDNLVIRRP